MPSDCAVALTDRRRLPLRNLASLLSVREHAEAMTYARPERRRRTVASRLLTKYLVAEPRTSRQVHWVSAGEIDAAGHAELASLEVLSGKAGARGTPTLVRGGRPCRDLSASSSHCGPFTASCVGAHRLGLDLERIEPRRREFYEHTFSREERDWAYRMGANRPGSTEAAFTLLWSLKEAFLKASGRNDFTVWSFPRWTVRVGDGMQQVLGPKAPDELSRVPGGICGPDFWRIFEIAAMRIDDMILATVQY